VDSELAAPNLSAPERGADATACFKSSSWQWPRQRQSS